MSHQYRVRTQDQIHFITFTVVDWVDIFIRPAYKKIIINSLKYAQENKGLELYAWCLMTNHLHLLVSIKEPFLLSDFVRDFKKFTNKEIIKLMDTEHESRRDWMLYRFSYHAKFNNRIKDYKVWQDGYHAIECFNHHILAQKLDYIHNNPVKAEIVALPEEYLYSSAKNYLNEKGLLNVIKVDTSFSDFMK
jgi:REP element-mobilizing transposase RayT